MKSLGLSRNSSRSRPNTRLQDRLAKAVVKGAERPGSSRASSELPSRAASPALSPDLGRTSLDSKVSDTTPETAPDQPSQTDQPPKSDITQTEELPRTSSEAVPAEATSLPSIPMPIPEIHAPPTPSPRTSLDSSLSRPSIELPTTHGAESDTSSPRSPSAYESELSSLRKTHEESLLEHREELNSHLERIDALQSKLAYLSQSLATQARAAFSSPDTKDPLEKKLAEKDIQIAALMEEGQNLSKTELKHLTTIKKMRAKAGEADKEISALKQRLSKAEKSISEATERAKRSEAAERAAQEKLKIVGRIEKDFDALRAEREEAGLTIGELRRQLNDTLNRAEEAEKRVQTGALEAEKRVVAELREDLENVRIEKKLAGDRAKNEIRDLKEDAARQQERAKVSELELKGEIAVSITATWVINIFSLTELAIRILRLNSNSSVLAPKKSLHLPQVIRRLNFSAKLKLCRLNMLSPPKTGMVSKVLSRLASLLSKRSVTRPLSGKAIFVVKHEI